MSLEKQLFEVPEGIEFPMELCHHLKTKLHTALEHNYQLTQHISNLDQELLKLKQTVLEQAQTKSPERFGAHENESESIMASKIVELSKKIRDMTAQMESMKTKMKKLMAENQQLREQAEAAQAHPSENCGEGFSQSEEDLPATAAQMSQLTMKMMEYRRQCQQLRIELKTALRALSQEVGDSCTPLTVLNSINNPSWRGRQQQIIALQQKLADIQLRHYPKCSDPNDPNMSTVGTGMGDGDAQCYHETGGAGSSPTGTGLRKVGSVASIASSATSLASHRTGLLQQDMKKQEQIKRLSGEVEQLTEDLKIRQHDLKSSKARIQTLEAQTKSYRNQLDLLEAKLQEKEIESKRGWDEMNRLKQELIAVKDREKRSRDQHLLEIQEGNRAFTRERAIVSRLQQVINEKQETIQKTDAEIIELRNKLERYCSDNNVTGGLKGIERMQDLQSQLQSYIQLLSTSEQEQQRLMGIIDKVTEDSERERNKVIQAQREFGQVYVVLQQANKCIDDCLDAANVTDPGLLQAVENIRTMIRELKTGELYSLNADCNSVVGPMPAKRLRVKVELLNKEVALLQNKVQELNEKLKKGISQNSRVYEELKEEFGGIFHGKK